LQNAIKVLICIVSFHADPPTFTQYEDEIHRTNILLDSGRQAVQYNQEIVAEITVH